MKLTVLGTELIDYTSKKTGRPVKGISLHCALKQQGVDGQAVESVFISDALDCYPRDVFRDSRSNGRRGIPTAMDTWQTLL